MWERIPGSPCVYGLLCVCVCVCVRACVGVSNNWFKSLSLRIWVPEQGSLETRISFTTVRLLHFFSTIYLTIYLLQILTHRSCVYVFCLATIQWPSSGQESCPNGYRKQDFQAPRVFTTLTPQPWEIEREKTHSSDFAVVISFCQIPCQTKIAHFEQKALRYQHVAGSKVTVYTLQQREAKLSLSNKKFQWPSGCHFLTMQGH